MGASGLYLYKHAPKVKVREDTPSIQVGTASGEAHRSSSTCELAIPNLPEDFPVSGHVMPGFQENLVGTGPICDADYSVTFTKEAVSIYSPKGHRVLMGWRETEAPRLWRMSLLPEERNTPDITAPNAQQSTLKAFSAYNLPSVEALIRYFHAASGFLVQYTWMRAIKAGNFDSWPGITYYNATK